MISKQIPWLAFVVITALPSWGVAAPPVLWPAGPVHLQVSPSTRNVEPAAAEPCPLAEELPPKEPSISRFKAMVEGLSNFFRLNREDENRWSNAELLDHIKLSARVARGFMNDPQSYVEIGFDPELDAMIGRHPDLLETLTKHTALMDLYAMDAGVWEGYSIEEHTLRVLDMYSSQSRFFDLDHTRIRSTGDVKRLMRYTVALHDIGKGLAVQGGNKSQQEHFNGAVAAQALRHLGFSKKEVRLARSLIENNAIGEMLMNRIPVQEAYRRFQEAARSADEPVSALFRLQSLFYNCDAGSYPTLNQSVFTHFEGGISPKSPKFTELEKLIAGDPDNFKRPKPLPEPVASPKPPVEPPGEAAEGDSEGAE